MFVDMKGRQVRYTQKLAATYNKQFQEQFVATEVYTLIQRCLRQ